MLGLLLCAGLPAAAAAQPGEPARVLTRAELVQSGRTALPEILQSLLPAFQAPRPSVAGGTDHVPLLALHGLGVDQLLVLVNGKRRHDSALLNVDTTLGRGQGMADLSGIPLSAIERIELYTDGGAARFGLGAVAGAINIVLRSGGADDAAATLGATTAGDGAVLQGLGSYHLAWGRDGFLQLSAEARSRGATNRALPDRRTQYFPSDPRNDDPALNNRITHRFGDPESQELSGFLNAAKHLAAGVELYAFGGLGRRSGEAGERWRRASEDGTVRALYPDGFLPLIAPKINDGSALAGVRGRLFGWSWDASAGYGRSSFRFDVEQTANVSLGPQSPTRFHAGTLRSDQFSAAVELSRRIIPGFLPPLLLTLGGLHRSDGYQIQPGEPDSYRYGAVLIPDGPHAGNIPPLGAQGFPGFRPGNAVTKRRDMLGAYGELSTVLLRKLSLGAAGRIEDFGNFGTLGVFQLYGGLGPIRGLSVRASYGRGGRVPTLAQAWYSSSFTSVAGQTALEHHLVPVSDPLAVLLGARPLRPERSRNLSLGGTLAPLHALTLSAEYYHVSVDDRIILSGSFDDPAVRQFLENQQRSGIGSVRFFNNAIATRTTGVDAGAAYRFRLGGATIRTSAAFNHTTTRVTRIDSLTGPLAPFTSVFFDRVERARLERGQPQDNLILAGYLTRGRVTITVRAQRFGRVTSFGAPADGSLDQTYGARWLGDLGAGYDFGGRWSLQLGADNLLDVYPQRNGFGDANVEGNSNFGMFPYSNLSPFGFNGRFVWLRVRWTR